MSPRLALAVTALVIASVNLRPAIGQEFPVPTLHAVIVTPSDVNVPRTATDQIRRAVAAAESFFFDEMADRGYPANVEHLFERDSDGEPRVLHVQGTAPKRDPKYKNADFVSEVHQTAMSQYDLPRNRGLWWIFVYVGDPPTRFSTYRGSGDAWRGGWAICNFSTNRGEIDPTASLATRFHEQWTLKGCIHELGHALGLPHLGPVGSGTSAPLMGPNIDVFERVRKTTVTDVHLSEAAAAMLWKHPLMTGDSARRNLLPKPKWTDIKTRYSDDGNSLTLSGRVSAEIAPHSVVLVDEAPERNNYFRKPYVGRVERGRFAVTITELGPGDGTLHLFACFENGTWTGNGQARGFDGGLRQPYRERRGRYVFAK